MERLNLPTPYPATHSDHVRNKLAAPTEHACNAKCNVTVRSLSELELGKTDYIRGALTCAFIYYSALL